VKLDGWGMRSFPTHKPGPFYSVREARPDDHDDRCVRGTADELSAWRDAELAFREAVDAAARAYSDAVSRWRWLPGQNWRVRRACQAFQQALDAAEAAYRPVRDEIRGREAAREEEKRRAREELAELRKACAERAIWGWSTVDSRTVRVFESKEQGLTAAELAEALRGMYESGIRDVQWDRAATAAVARACTRPGTQPNGREFEEWWRSVAGWGDPWTIPAPPRACTGRLTGVTGHLSSFGGGYDGGGGYSGGACFGVTL